MYTPDPSFTAALAYAEQAYQHHRKWNTDARPQEARRADLLREIESHYNYGVAFLDRKQYRKEYERAIRKRNRARILFEELLERADHTQPIGIRRATRGGNGSRADA